MLIPINPNDLKKLMDAGGGAGGGGECSECGADGDTSLREKIDAEVSRMASRLEKTRAVQRWLVDHPQFETLLEDYNKMTEGLR